ncbi:Putative serine hydrolase FSH, alpha/Beta hydrolase [Septoria linicola]|uniref:Serine hydrolase FSH, alpha/Beta hydrolase n=1 Tax=Septoria linicola TaxID=215465 RepID=A0A9Q9B257_9PEZI|nr:Putative serine hydrolase FSH, alpha/Beta hydrolase [Septoria linicola]
MTIPAKSRLRILCLHGFTSNASVHAFQLRRLISSLSQYQNQSYDFLFPSGPHTVLPSSASMDMTSPATQLWHDFVVGLSPESEKLGHRAWWYARDPDWKTKRKGEFEGLEESFKFLGKFLEGLDGPVDAVWGFSQGACLAGMLVALLQDSQREHPLRKMLPERQGSVKCGVIFSGFRARFEMYDDIYEVTNAESGWKGIDVPVMHVIGEKDPLVGSERSVALMRCCREEEVLRFEGGHEIPKGEGDVAKIVEFVRRYCEVGGKGEDEGMGEGRRVQASM